MYKRIFDVFLASIILFIFCVPILCICVLIPITSKGPSLYWSRRVGKKNKLFDMPKFRTMKIQTPVLATHLLTNPESYLTPIGGFLRKSSLDELPQLWSILRGDMSLVGPRPALSNQQDLIELRTGLGIDALVPGLTGWAQINGRDEISLLEKVKLDEFYLQNQSLSLDLKIICITVIKAATRCDIIH